MVDGDERLIARLMRFLQCLADRPTVTVEEISQQCGVPVSTGYRLIRMLVDSGFAQRVSPGRYSAGAVSVKLAQRYRDQALTTGAITGSLRRLSEQSGEFAAYMVPHDDEILCVDAAESPRYALRCCYTIGASQPLLRGATATAILSHMSSTRRTQIFSRHGLDRKQSQEIEDSCRTAERVGYAISAGVLDEGVWGVSAPVVDGREVLQGVVTLMAPVPRVTDRKQHYIRLVLETSQALSGGNK